MSREFNASGYMKLISIRPRTWKLYDADGKEIASGDCIACTSKAIDNEMRIFSVH